MKYTSDWFGSSLETEPIVWRTDQAPALSAEHEAFARGMLFESGHTNDYILDRVPAETSTIGLLKAAFFLIATVLRRMVGR